MKFSISDTFRRYNIKNTIKIAIIICSINIFLSLFYNYIMSIFKFNYAPNPIPFNNIYEDFFLVVCLAPIIETGLFQFIPAHFLKRFNKLKIILISSIIFSLSHWYSVLNFVYGFIIGILFITGYFYAINKKSNPVLTIIFSHAFYNIYAFVMNNYNK